MRSHDLITREGALKAIYFKRDNAANFAIQMDPAKTISQHLRAITTTDERVKRKLQKISSDWPYKIFSVPLKGMVGKGKAYTIIDAKKVTVHTVLVGDMTVLVSVAKSPTRRSRQIMKVMISYSKTRGRRMLIEQLLRRVGSLVGVASI